MNSKIIFNSLYPMEKKASDVYTRKIFKKFQDELIHFKQYIVEKVNIDKQVYSYKVHEFKKKNQNIL